MGLLGFGWVDLFVHAVIVSSRNAIKDVLEIIELAAVGARLITNARTKAWETRCKQYGLRPPHFRRSLCYADKSVIATHDDATAEEIDRVLTDLSVSPQALLCLLYSFLSYNSRYGRINDTMCIAKTKTLICTIVKSLPTDFTIRVNLDFKAFRIGKLNIGKRMVHTHCFFCSNTCNADSKRSSEMR